MIKQKTAFPILLGPDKHLCYVLPAAFLQAQRPIPRACARGCRLKIKPPFIPVSDVGRSRNIRHNRNIPSLVCCTCCDCCGCF